LFLDPQAILGVAEGAVANLDDAALEASLRLVTIAPDNFTHATPDLVVEIDDPDGLVQAVVADFMEHHDFPSASAIAVLRQNPGQL
jgi:hypothetical protein